MIGRTLAFAAALALLAAGVSAAEWMGNSRHAEHLVAAKYSTGGVKSPKVEDTGQTVENGGMTWRIFTVTWKDGRLRHVAVHRDAKGQYLAIEGLGKTKRWSQAVSLGH